MVSKLGSSNLNLHLKALFNDISCFMEKNKNVLVYAHHKYPEMFNSFPASDDLFSALQTVLNRDQTRQNVWPDLESNHLALIVSLKESLKTFILIVSANDNKGIQNYPACKELNHSG